MILKLWSTCFHPLNAVITGVCIITFCLCDAGDCIQDQVYRRQAQFTHTHPTWVPFPQILRGTLWVFSIVIHIDTNCVYILTQFCNCMDKEICHEQIWTHTYPRINLDVLTPISCVARGLPASSSIQSSQLRKFTTPGYLCHIVAKCPSTIFPWSFNLNFFPCFCSLWSG